MNKFLCGLAALPFLAASALAQPAPLSETQLDQVSAGWVIHEIDVSNTSWTEVAVYTGLRVECSNCYLHLVSPQVSIQSNMGPTPTFNPM